MNIGFIVCSVLCLFFLLLAVVFSLLKEKGAVLISGFNTMPKEKRELYDKKRMSEDQRNSLVIWAAIFAAGAGLSYYLTQYAAIPSFAAWLILFFKDVHLDAEKAFEKYIKH